MIQNVSPLCHLLHLGLSLLCLEMLAGYSSPNLSVGNLSDGRNPTDSGSLGGHLNGLQIAFVDTKPFF